MISLSHGIGQNCHIVGRQMFSVVNGTGTHRRHARLTLARMNIHGRAIVLEHGNQRFRQGNVIPIRVDVDEVQYFPSAVSLRARQSAAAGDGHSTNEKRPQVHGDTRR